MITGKLDQPREFGRYILVAKVASGGMASVFRAELRPDDPRHGQTLAIKILHDHLADDPDFIRMFKDEGRIVRDFDHPNVVKVYEVGEIASDHYLAMEFVDGRDLGQLLVAHKLNHQTMASPVAFEIMRQALTALRYVHGWKGKNGRCMGIVHRDISPQNLLISRQGLVKMTDFGIARGDHRSDRTRTGTVKGKMHYMAPEQAAGERVDQRADLYSMGAVAYEMLTGQPLFGPGTTDVLQTRAMAADIDFGPKFERLPDDVKHWLRRSLAANPEMRFQSADAMLASMEQLTKASRALYRSEQLLRMLELPEARRSAQRDPKLFPNEIKAQARKNAAGAAAAAAAAESSSVNPGSHVELDTSARNLRLRNDRQGESVDWSAQGEAAVRPATGVRDDSGKRAARASRADLLPVEVVTGRTYPTPTGASAKSAPTPAALRDGVSVAVVGSAKASQGADWADEASKTDLPRKAASKASAKQPTGQGGLALANFAAALCGALVLLAVLQEVTGAHVQLPEADNLAIAQLFDDDAPKARTDATAASTRGTRRAMPNLGGTWAAGTAELALPSASSPTQNQFAGNAASPATVAVAAPVPAIDPVAQRKRAEIAAEKAVHDHVEVLAWRPLEHVAKPGDKSALDPEAGSRPKGGQDGRAVVAIVKSGLKNEKIEPCYTPAPASKQPVAKAIAGPASSRAQVVVMPHGAAPTGTSRPAENVNHVANNDPGYTSPLAPKRATPVAAPPVPQKAPAAATSAKTVGVAKATASPQQPQHAVAAQRPSQAPTPVAVKSPSASKPSASAAVMNKASAPAKPAAKPNLGTPSAKVAVPAKAAAAKGATVTPAGKRVVPKAVAHPTAASAAVPAKSSAAKAVPAKPVTAKAVPTKPGAAKVDAAKASAAKAVPAKPVAASKSASAKATLVAKPVAQTRTTPAAKGTAAVKPTGAKPATAKPNTAKTTTTKAAPASKAVAHPAPVAHVAPSKQTVGARSSK